MNSLKKKIKFNILCNSPQSPLQTHFLRECDFQVEMTITLVGMTAETDSRKLHDQTAFP